MMCMRLQWMAVLLCELRADDTHSNAAARISTHNVLLLTFQPLAFIGNDGLQQLHTQKQGLYLCTPPFSAAPTFPVWGGQCKRGGGEVSVMASLEFTVILSLRE